MNRQSNIFTCLYSLLLCMICILLFSILQHNEIPHLKLFLYTMLILSMLFFFVLICLNIRRALTESTDVVADPLTGLNAIQLFYAKSTKKWKQHHSGYVVVMDITRFRFINDRYGSECGNDILLNSAHIIKDSIDSHSIICRIHSDVFCMYIYHADKKEILNYINVISTRMRNTKPVTIDPSFGICKTDKETDIHTALSYAEMALKSAKSHAAVLYEEFSSEMLAQVKHDMDMEQEMYHALETKQFQVFLQPKYSLDTETIVGAEALVRWQHPKKGLISPNEFISLFEQNGFIKKLDEYMWNEAAHIIHEWEKAGISPIPVSVNVSRVHNLGEDLCDRLLAITITHRISPKYLQLEFTENAYIENLDGLHETMRILRNRGFTILMDDFGSGYSSLNMLKDYPVDIIKTDKEFLHMDSKDEDAKGERIILHVVGMIRDLGLDIVAEGVETKHQINLLQKCGCNVVQGYYYSPPLHHTEFTKLLIK